MAAVSLVNKTPSRSLLAGNVGFGTGYEWIQSITVGSLGASSVSFTEIPQGYRHLQVRATVRSTSAVNEDNFIMRFNSDSGTNYRYHNLTGNGASASSGDSGATTFIQPGSTAASSLTSGIFGTHVIDILDYSSTVKNKTARALYGFDNNGTAGRTGLFSGLWLNTSAVSTITFSTGGSLAQYSTFSLYGIR